MGDGIRAAEMREKDDAEMKEPGLAVVGIGASAGGLNALRNFFKHVEEDTGLAFVVVVHLSPDHESHLADLLQPHVNMPVQQVTETVPLRPNHVYVIPPGCNLSTIDTHLRLSNLEERRRERAPIDHFFRTLSKTHHGHSIGVVLTGTGSDGTLGLREIHLAGGLTLVQDPNEAEYDGMPQSAISTGVIDHVLPIAEIPDAILAFTATEPRLSASDPEREERELEQHLLFKIFAQIRAGTGRDFTRYKPATILRRIARRMQLARIEELGEYLVLLRSEPEEVRALADDMLITVTSFFRDPEVFAHLETEIIPEIFERNSGSDAMRAWTVGCATGEEAYSMAMLLVEEAERREEPPQVQVFASDLHEQALKSARDGFYPGDIETDVSPERLARWFTKENGGYRIKRELREMVVFAPHNILGDPPFSRLDLVSCRNLMIYLNREVQDDVIGLFHYALRPSGFLMLGTSETIDGSELFHTVHKKHNLYRKRDVVTPEPRLRGMPALRMQMEGAVPQAEGRFEPATYDALHRKMIEAHAPPSILVGPDDRVVHVSKHAGRYLTIPGGAVTAVVHRLVREELRIDLRSALHQARESGRPVRTRPLNVRLNGEARSVVAVVRLGLEPRQEGFLLVIFDEREPLERSEDGPPVAGEADGTVLSEKDAELELTRHRLQTIIEEYETTQEEMWASNEELQSANEELRSTMEELETSKEELQSMNEELHTVNQENRHKVDELSQLSGDLQNLFSATDIATLFLDRSLRILRFTPRVGELFSVRPADRGRPLGDLTHRLGYKDLLEDARHVIERLVPVEREIEDADGRWFLSRILPYRSTDDRIEGVVITFIEISERKRNEEEVRKAKVYAESIIETLHQPLLVLEPDLSVKTANQAFYDHFESVHESTIGRNIYDLGNGQWDIPELRTLLEEVLPDSEVFNDYEVRHTFEDIGERVMLLNARRLDHVQLILLGIQDITEKRKSDEARLASEERYRMLFNSIDEGFCTIEVLFDEDGKPFDCLYLETNPAFERQTGLENVVGRTVRELIEGHEEAWFDIYGHIARTGEPRRFEREATEMGRFFDLYAFRVGDPDDHCVAVLFKDISQRRQTEEALRESEERFRAVSNLVPDLLWRSDAAGNTTWYNDRWIEYTGQTPQGALGWGWIDAIHPDDRARSAESYRHAAERGQTLQQEHRIRRHDGEYRWFLVRAEPQLDENEEVIYFFGTATDVHEQHEARKTLEGHVKERTQQVRELARRLTMAEQEERHRISQILHDDLQQLLYGVDMKLEILRRSGEKLDPAAFYKNIDETRDWVGRAVATTRELTVELSPPILRSEGLADALEWLQRQMKELHGLSVELVADHPFRIPDESLRVLLTQIIRELLFNIKKHAGVDHAVIELAADENMLVATVIDEGHGFEASKRVPGRDQIGGFGLYSARERLQLVGGSLEVFSAPNMGSRIVIRCPYDGTVPKGEQGETER
jgi:PAS domain S-box-containing protein